MLHKTFILIIAIFIFLGSQSFGQPFTKITDSPVVSDGANSQSATWGDYDNDGYLDLFVANWEEENLLYHNNGDGTFTQITQGIVVNDGDENSLSASWIDYDNDGYLDLFVVGNYGCKNSLYHNEGDGTFTKITQGEIVNEEYYAPGCSWGDFDNDGYLDVLVSNYSLYPSQFNLNNFLYFNNGDGTFTKTILGDIVNDGGRSIGISSSDYDNDGDLDVFIANGGSYEIENNFFYKNNGDGTFIKETESVVVHDSATSFGGNWGDYDNDGDFDLLVTNGWTSTPINYLYQNNGDGSFTYVEETVFMEDLGNYNSSTWGDYDNDGYLDLFVAAHLLFDPNLLYHNDGDGTFTKITEGDIVNDIGRSYAAAWADYDNDGDLDIFVANPQQDNFLYRNDQTGTNWINIKCIGTDSNMSAIGTKVKAKATVYDTTFWQFREIASQNSWSCQNGFNVHFGLGDATMIDSLIVEWASGNIEIFTDVAVNQFLTITEVSTGINDDPEINIPAKLTLHQNYPNPFNPETRISFQIPQTSKVSETFEVYLNIYDISGKLVKTLIDDEKEPGYHSVVWDGKDETGREVSSGVYFYKLDAGNEYSEVKQMILLK